MKRIILSCVILFHLSLSAQKLEVVGGYFPYWRNTSAINFDHYNYLYYAFVFPTATGGIQYSNSRNVNFDQFKTATKTVKSKKLISVGSTGMPEMAKDPKARLQFADTLRKFCRIHQLQGIDMDWESINNSTDRDNFTALMKEIRQTIDSTNLEFVITVGFGNYWLQWYDNEALKQADFLQIMIYDQTGTWDGSPYGNHSSMDHFIAADKYWTGRGFPRNKLAMGLPYYGYKFKSETGGLAEAVTYSEILKQFPNIKSSDNNLSNSTGYYWFNGVDLINQKINYAIDNGFKGVFVWEIAQDDVLKPLSLDATLFKSTSILSSVQYETYSPEKISTFPNPTKNQLNISGLGDEFINGEIRIQTLDGTVLETFMIKNTSIETVLVNNYKSGVYILSVSSTDKTKNRISKIMIDGNWD